LILAGNASIFCSYEIITSLKRCVALESLSKRDETSGSPGKGDEKGGGKAEKGKGGRRENSYRLSP
jgi:ribosomal protein L4